ncbi:MAG: polysaccharide biosynthesis protein PslG [Thermoleophilaceae bacterium]|nr:polysaccharide biosynthesis protein PslG [Thermoleophilaceae bacterium]
MSSRSSGQFVRKVLLAVVPAALMLSSASPALANNKQESILQDDGVFGNTDLQAEGLTAANDLGVDTIHTLVGWDSLAPNSSSTTKPSGFNGADPGAYPAENWDHLDDLVRGAHDKGIDLILSPTGPTPRWASSCKASEVESGTPFNCKPSAKEYQAFFTAVAKRYTGKYSDENQGGGKLPKVSRFSIWNEPNIKGWIYPTSQNAKLYRDLVYAGVAGAAKGGQKRAQLYLGETAPLNNSLLFIQNLFCIDGKGKSLTGKAATKQGCKSGKKIKRLAVTGYAHHPYARGGGPPFKKGKKYDLTLADTAKLQNVLTLGGKAGAVKKGLPIYFSEFGVTTKPEDDKFGVSYDDQAEDINRGEQIAYDNKSVRSWVQYELNNDTVIGSTPGTDVRFQTGLRYIKDGVITEKPSFGAFRMPLYVTGKTTSARVWGGVKPGKAKDSVEIQAGKGGTFTTLKTVKLDKYGYINVKKVKIPSGSKVRLAWTNAGGTQLFSREAVVRKQ